MSGIICQVVGCPCHDGLATSTKERLPASCRNWKDSLHSWVKSRPIFRSFWKRSCQTDRNLAAQCSRHHQAVAQCSRHHQAVAVAVASHPVAVAGRSRRGRIVAAVVPVHRTCTALHVTATALTVALVCKRLGYDGIDAVRDAAVCETSNATTTTAVDVGAVRDAAVCETSNATTTTAVNVGALEAATSQSPTCTHWMRTDYPSRTTKTLANRTQMPPRNKAPTTKAVHRFR